MSDKICHPIQGICAILNLVGEHLDSRDWWSPSLTADVLPSDVRVVYKCGAETEERQDALPVIAYTVNGIRMSPILPNASLNRFRSDTITEVTSGIVFRVSTTSHTLTDILALEVAGHIMSNHKELQSARAYVGDLTIGKVAKEASGYYICDITMNVSLDRAIWTKAKAQGILREVDLQVDANESTTLT